MRVATVFVLCVASSFGFEIYPDPNSIFGMAPGPRPPTTPDERIKAEWKRWRALADETIKTLPAPDSVFVPVDLDAFPQQSMWTGVLSHCRAAGRTCVLDVFAVKLQKAENACQYCNEDGTPYAFGPGYAGSTKEHCEECMPKLLPLRATAKDPARQVVASVSRNHVLHSKDAPLLASTE